MLPLVVATTPINGSDGVDINSNIFIELSDTYETITASNIIIENTNLQELIGFTLENNIETNILIISPLDSNAYGTNKMLGLTKYKLTLKHPLDTSSYSMTFITESDNIEDVIIEPELDVGFKILKSYPRDKQINISPDYIKIKLSKNIEVDSVTNDTLFITDSDIYDVEDIGFLPINQIEGTILVEEDIITFTPNVAFPNNSKYTIFLRNILSDEETPSKLNTSIRFDSAYYPMYANIDSILDKYKSVEILAKNMTQHELYSIIKANSEMVDFLVELRDLDIDLNNPPKAVIEYTITKTRYDIVFDEYIKLSSRETSKTLSDLSIEYGNNIKDLLALANKLKLEYEYWENQIKGNISGKAAPSTFIKGEEVDEVPEFKNRQFKDYEGVKSW